MRNPKINVRGLAERIYRAFIAEGMECSELMISDKDAITTIENEILKKPEQPCDSCGMEENCYSVHTCDDYQSWNKEMAIWRISNE